MRRLKSIVATGLCSAVILIPLFPVVATAETSTPRETMYVQIIGLYAQLIQILQQQITQLQQQLASAQSGGVVQTNIQPTSQSASVTAKSGLFTCAAPTPARCTVGYHQCSGAGCKYWGRKMEADYYCIWRLYPIAIESVPSGTVWPMNNCFNILPVASDEFVDTPTDHLGCPLTPECVPN